VGIADILTLRSDGVKLTPAVSVIDAVAGLYAIEVGEAEDILAAAHIELVFNLGNLLKANNKAVDALSAFDNYVGLNNDGTTLTIYTFADNLPVYSLAAISARRASKTAPITL